ncbi:MAG: glycosyltransferase [Hymenobacteraceae bacterium]|nr:glycosyltransferase [Hymenobacteraceae bacterium]MDX5395575.1 glycosyltransferase [Hymenobacteraceae bacterium]MDX5443282.1 glycosyltransferase [Hymenobacteraceae bacterium]MDX5511627.1 glycosyltransferase [Hymenobacteraceae bacterium]
MAKITMIGPAHPLRGGLATYNERLARAFQQHGDQVIIKTFSLQYPSFLFPGQTQFSSDPAPSDLAIEVSVNSVNPLNWIKIGLQVKKQKPDILMFRFWLPFMGPCFGTIARLAKQNKHTKVLVLMDNAIPHEKRIGDLPLTQYFLSACDGFITMSEAVQQDLAQLQPGKPTVFQPHPLYDTFGTKISKTEARSKLNLDQEEKYLLFFGFIRAYKGLDLLLQALSDPRLKQQQIKLIVAGEYYEDAKPYQDLIEKLQLQDRVVLATTYIPTDLVAAYFCAADLVVQPYKSATQSGVSQIAYHFDKPMVVTDVGGLAETVPHGKVGYVVQPEPKEIADAIDDFFRYKREEEFVRNMPEQKQRFSWEAMVEAIHALAQKIK